MLRSTLKWAENSASYLKRPEEERDQNDSIEDIVGIDVTWNRKKKTEDTAKLKLPSASFIRLPGSRSWFSVKMVVSK